MAQEATAARETETEVLTAESGTLAVITKAEIDVQIATARQFPRSIKKFRSEMMDMVTLTEKVAEECIYALPRDGKTIEGPSARFAEIAASAWGNCRAGARTVNEDNEFVTSQGVFHDLERNVAITYEVKRRITNKFGKRFSADMVGVTANAACSIALRNAILKGIPKAFWAEMYDAARKAAIGDVKSLANKRAEMLGYFQKMSVTPDRIFAALNVPGVEDIGVDELVVLKGIATAIKDGDTTVEQAFPAPQKEGGNGKGIDGLKEKLGVTPEKKEPESDGALAGAAADPGQEKKDPPATAEASTTSGTAETKKEEDVPFPDPDPKKDAAPAEKVPAETVDVGPYLNKFTSAADLDARWLACKPVVDKAGTRMKPALEKLYDDLKKKAAGGAS
ncbi:MAG: hypothetical protein IH577_04590 [Deltaproteobacteria bacterium]|nr:hypothetical protein [Deltaproteobacteria bacterium]